LQDTDRPCPGRPSPRAAPRPVELRATSLNNRALSLLDLGKRQEAEEAWHEALDRDPRHPEATYNFGLLHRRSGRITDEDLVDQLDGVCQTHPGNWLPLCLLSQVHLERADGERALEALGRISAADAGRAEVQACRKVAEAIQPEPRRLLRALEGLADVNAVALSTDGRWIISGGNDRTVRLWEAATGQCHRTFYGPADG